MAYRKRYYKKRTKRSSNRKAWMKTGANVASTAYSAYKLATKVARMVNSEIKFLDTQNTALTLDSTGGVVSLCTIPQGDGDNSRDGSSCKPAQMTLRATISPNASATTPTTVRVILFRAKTEKSTAPTLASLLEDTTQFDALVSPKQWSEKFNTKIIYDRLFTVGDYSSGSDPEVIRFRINKKLFGHIKWATNDTAGTDIENGGLYMAYVSSASSNAPTMCYYNRLTYYDN